MSRIRRILHATDFSPASGAAFARAVEMARANGAELSLAHVLSPIVPLTGDGYVAPQVYADLEASTTAGAERQLKRLADRARKAGIRRVRTVVLRGVPHEQIARAARQADLAVIGTHGRSGLAKLFVGSVASRVVAASPRPVLTVRGR